MSQIFPKDRDLISWLEKKVSSLSSMPKISTAPNDDEEIYKNFSHNNAGLWNCRQVSSLLNAELLTECQSCFVDLQTPIKLKLLLSILHLSRRNLDQWRNELDDVLSLAGQDIDEWVQTVAEFLKDVPSLGALNFNVHKEECQFTKTLTHLKKMLKKQQPNPSLLPKDAAFVNKNLLPVIWSSSGGGSLTTAKHFNLRRKTKAAAQRVELLQKSHDAPSQTKAKNSSLSHHVPIKGRDTVRKMDTNTPMKGIPSQNPNKLSAGFSATSKMYTRPIVTKKEGGAKLIDIADTPEMMKKRRKEIEKEEKANVKLQREEQRRKREQERQEARDLKRKQAAENRAAAAAAAAAEDEEDVAQEEPQPPSYVADLLQAVGSGDATMEIERRRQRERAILEHHFEAQPQAPETQPTSIPTPVIMDAAYINQQQPHTDHNFAAQPPPLTSAASNFARAFYQPQPQTQGVVRVDMPGRQSQSLFFRQPAVAAAETQGKTQTQGLNFYGSQPNLMGETSNLGINRNVVLEAQEMFKTANKLTRPEKALILGFMAGNRDNPCPQMGNVLTVRLSENLENQLQMDGTVRQALIETYFQMNYENGEWKKLRKTRIL